MVLNAGFSTFEFRKTGELRFASPERALNWLKQMAARGSDLKSRFRELLARYGESPDNSRLTDHQVLERLAEMLYARRIVVIGQENGGAKGQPTPKDATTPPPFPLSERSSTRKAPPPAKSEAVDPPTFSADTYANDQAAALVNAAVTGVPFCAECAAAAARRENS